MNRPLLFIMTLLISCHCIHAATTNNSALNLHNIKPGNGTYMFNNRDLTGWKPLKGDKYTSGGIVTVTNKTIDIKPGKPYSAIQWQGTFPSNNYTVSLRAKRTQFEDIFCGLLFPVGSNFCTMVLGGWANNVVGLSCVDNELAADNIAAVSMRFDNDKWYSVALTVTETNIIGTIDSKEVINLTLADHTISPYPGMEELAPFAIFTYDSGAALKDIYLRSSLHCKK